MKDIHDWLEVTVYDEDKDHKYEFLGKLKIPLLKIRNSERRWYSLKDKTLRKPAKGDHPQILLEMFFVYNKVNNRSLTYYNNMDYVKKIEFAELFSNWCALHIYVFQNPIRYVLVSGPSIQGS